MSRSSSFAAIATLGIDLGKNTFHLIGQDERGAIVLRIKLSRTQLTQRLANIPPCLIGMEACAGAHHIGRQLQALGHDVRLIPAQYVKPFLKGHKNDYRDAEAIAEAVQRPTMSFVAIKTPEQMDLLGLAPGPLASGQPAHGCDQPDPRLPSRARPHRAAGARALAAGLARDPGFVLRCPSLRLVHLIADLAEDWRQLDERIAAVSAEIETLAAQDEHCQRLMSVPGVGPIISSAVVAAIGTGAGFKQGRDFGAWLGLVPKQESTGDRTILGKISKRGNKYLRTLFVQAAHIVLVRRPHGARLGLWPWIETAGRRLHRNMLVIALANKLARIAWAVLARGHAYQPRSASHAVRGELAREPFRNGFA